MRRSRFCIALLALSSLASSCSSKEAAAPPPTKLPSAPIDVLVDAMGVPHVYAKNDEDAFYGAGYQMASDRLYQMEMLRRFAFGRLSEVLGKDGFERDHQSRVFDFPRWGRADFELMKTAEPERVRLMHAWVTGINARIKEVLDKKVDVPFGFRKSERDFEPELWDDADPFVVLKGAGFALDKTIEFEIAITLVSQIYPDPIAAVNLLQPAHANYGVPPEDRPKGGGHEHAKAPKPAPKKALSEAETRDAFRALDYLLDSMPRHPGSNNWAVDGRFTDTKKPMLAGDPHLAFDFFGAPYPLHINSKDAGGTYDVAGFAYPGTPGIALGHNQKLMWTATSAFADVTDVWSVSMSGEGAIKVGAKTAPLTDRTEHILVRDPGGPVGKGQDMAITYQDVDGYGVMLPKELLPFPVGGPYLIGWTGFTARPSRWFMELNRAENLDDFEASVDRMREMNYSFVAADQTGIAYRVGVDVPKRADVSGSRAPFMVMSADDEKSLWTGEKLDRNQLPRSRAKQRGWIATANNDPFGFTDDGRVDNDPWYYGAFFDAGYRANRIETEVAKLTAKGGVTVEAMKALQTDIHSTLADDLLPALAAAQTKMASDPSLAQFKGDADLATVLDLLTKSWDREMSRDSAGAAAFNAFLHLLAAEVMKDDIPLAFDFAMKLESLYIMKLCAMGVLGQYPNASKFVQGGPELVMLTAAQKTAAFLKTRFGTVDPKAYKYGDIKVTDFDDAFGYGVPLFSKPSDGGEDTLRVAQNITFPEDGKPWVSTWVSVERSVGTFDEDGTPVDWVAFPVGANADPKSPDTQAALDDYLNAKYKKLLFKRPDIDAATAKKITLSP